MNSWYTIRAQATGAEVVIYDEIGAYGVSAKGFWRNWAHSRMPHRWPCG